MTTKERLHQLVDELSEAEAADTLAYAASRHEGTTDEWSDLDGQTAAATAHVMRDLAEQERAELGDTIAEAWERDRSG